MDLIDDVHSVMNIQDMREQLDRVEKLLTNINTSEYKENFSIAQQYLKRNIQLIEAIKKNDSKPSNTEEDGRNYLAEANSAMLNELNSNLTVLIKTYETFRHSNK